MKWLMHIAWGCIGSVSTGLAIYGALAGWSPGVIAWWGGTAFLAIYPNDPR